MATIDQIIGAAKAAEGKPYIYGDAGPNAFDCSGLITFVYGLAGVSLPHNAAAQQRSSKVTQVTNPQPGDLVFFGNPAYHVGLYVGNGQMISAPHTGAVVHQTSVGSGATYGRVQGVNGTVSGPVSTPGATVTTVSDPTGVNATAEKVLAVAKNSLIESVFLVLGLGLVGLGLYRAVQPALKKTTGELTKEASSATTLAGAAL